MVTERRAQQPRAAARVEGRRVRPALRAFRRDELGRLVLEHVLELIIKSRREVVEERAHEGRRGPVRRGGALARRQRVEGVLREREVASLQLEGGPQRVRRRLGDGRVGVFL